MSQTFTKLFSSITESTIWCEPAATRLVWITMLAMADSKGRVFGSIPGLANRARVDIGDCRQALNTLREPDPDSRSTNDEGRRIHDIEGGWQLINYVKYREMRDQEATKESKRKWAAKKRAEQSKSITIRADNVTVQNDGKVEKDF